MAEPNDAPDPGPNKVEVNDVTVVLDSNVVIDAYSFHNVAQDPDFDYRCSRARDALLLTIFLHDTAAVTCGLSEVVQVLQEKVPPVSGAPRDLFFTKAFIYFVKDRLLPRWDQGTRPT